MLTNLQTLDVSLISVYGVFTLIALHNLVRYIFLQQRYKGTGYKLLLFYIFAIASFVYKLFLLIDCVVHSERSEIKLFMHFEIAGIILYVLVYSTYILMLNDLKAILTVMLVQA